MDAARLFTTASVRIVPRFDQAATVTVSPFIFVTKVQIP